MDKTVAGLIGVIALAAEPGAAAEAAQVAPLQASSYADLLKPTPNALAIDAAARGVVAAAPDAPVVLAQYHHHHRVYRRRHHYYHHHHD